jgi:hypothetical protein
MTSSFSSPSKKKRVLLTLCERSLNRFEAERVVKEHCLNSSVSTLQNKHNIAINRKWETVPGFQQIPTGVCRYWVAPENVEQALKTAKFWS